MDSDDPRRAGDRFVGVLAQLQDSDRILASNQQAADEALKAMKAARAEEAETRARTSKLIEETQAQWQKAATEVENMTLLAADMRKRAQAEYDRQVSEGTAAGKNAHDAWIDKTIAAESACQAKQRQVTAMDEEVAKHQEVLDAVKREMSYLVARLKT